MFPYIVFLSTYIQLDRSVCFSPAWTELAIYRWNIFIILCIFYRNIFYIDKSIGVYFKENHFKMFLVDQENIFIFSWTLAGTWYEGYWNSGSVVRMMTNSWILWIRNLTGFLMITIVFFSDVTLYISSTSLGNNSKRYA